MIWARPVTFAGGFLLGARRARRSGREQKERRRADGRKGATRAGQRRAKQGRERKRETEREGAKEDGSGAIKKSEAVERDVYTRRRLLNASRTNLPRRVHGPINIRRIRGGGRSISTPGSSLDRVRVSPRRDCCESKSWRLTTRDSSTRASHTSTLRFVARVNRSTIDNYRFHWNCAHISEDKWTISNYVEIFVRITDTSL